MQGMSVSSSHFIATENFLMERLMKNTETLQNKFAYGLLPAQGEETYMRLCLEGKGDGTRLVLNSYHGITKGGCLVDIDQSQTVECECSPAIDIAEYGWDVVLTVSPFERRPCGEPNMQEEPPRYPFVDPVYKLSIIERDSKNVNDYGPFDVVVGLLRKKDGVFRLDDSYIPPSLSMTADRNLVRYMDLFTQSVSVMRSALGIIMEKAYSSNAGKTDVLDNTLVICRELQRSMADMYYKWQSYGAMLSPYQVTEIFGGIANSVLLGFSFMSKGGKDAVLKYFYEWNGVSPSAFEKVLDEVASKEYRQNRIDASMNSIYNMLKTLEELLVGLSKLDYVGQHKESMVISVSSAEENVENNKSSWLL